MTNLILAVVLLLLALVGIVARKTYYYLPLRELKRRAAKHDPLAVQLYRAAAYGNSLRGLLWLYIGLTSAASLVLLARLLPIWASLLIVGPLLWIAFSLIPATRTTKPGIYLTRFITPPLAWLLNYLHPLLERGAGTVERRYTAPDHTRLFEREDLLDLIKRQQHQPDNRITDEELEIVKRALEFDNYTVSQVMTPRKHIKTVLADDTIGPILIDEVHKSGQDYALVRESRKGPLAGTLAFKRLDLQSSGKVKDIMEPTVYYLHESDRLGQALHAFFVTNHPLFVVVDNFEEYIGVLTIENVLHQLLGHVPGDDFDQYTDIGLVAARHAKSRKPDPEPEESDETPVKTDDEVIE
ncbi:MAG TPA: CBS domain-containing protein [Candidatus Saccharimonadales bacterium]